MTTFEPKHLERWTLPANYAGAHWGQWYCFLGRNRDSGHLTESNYTQGLEAVQAAMNKELSCDTEEMSSVQEVRENHWAVGWVEWIAIHESDRAALACADEILGRLEDYPVLDDEDFSNREWEDYSNSWIDYGASEFIRALTSAFKLKDTTKYFLDDVDKEALREFFESLITSGEYFIGESSGVSINIKSAIHHVTRDQLATFLKTQRNQ